jgi:hypothetical protein
MDINAIREALHRQPFRPFIMRLADGRALSVPHPDFVAVAGRSVIVTSVLQNESYSVVESLLIVSLDYNGVATPPTGTSTGGNA